MSVTSPNPTAFKTTQPGGTGDHTPHTKIAQGVGDGASGTVVEINDGSDASRLAVGGSSIGNPGDASTANSIIGLLKRWLTVFPSALSPGGWLKVSIQEDLSGVPTGQAAMTASVPVTWANDQTPIPGQTPFSLLCGASTNETNVKASSATLFGGSVSNENTATRWFKLYDKATAPISSDVPKYRIAVPGGAHVMIGELIGPYGASFSAGLGFRTTTGRADADTGAIGATDLVVNLTYR